METNYNLIAYNLDKAAANAQAIPQVSIKSPFNLKEAYGIQSIVMSKRYLRGYKNVGLKLGFTSKAKMEQMGVHDMIWGRLTEDMTYANGGSLKKNKFIHPRAEPEIAFLVKKNINDIITKDDFEDYISSVCVAIEIIDSRYENFKFSLEDVVADNCSSAAYCLGDWKDFSTNINDIKINLSVDGKVVQEGNSTAILGNPYKSLTAISRLALDNGIEIGEGDIILAGAATPAIYIESEQTISANADGLGDVVLKVE